MFALNIFNSSIVLAKEQEKKVEGHGKELSKEEKKKKEIETIKKRLKKEKELNENQQTKNKQMFKSFKQQDFEDENYDLKVYLKNGAKILIYTHKKTGAQVYFNLVLDKEKAKNQDDYLIFRAPCKNDSGLVHFSEHCFTSFINTLAEKYKASSDDLNAQTSLTDFYIAAKAGMFGLNKKAEKEFIESLSKELTNPPVFEKENKIFEIEKKRILNEIKEKKSESYLILDALEREKIIDYDKGGELSQLKKIGLKDLKRFYEKYIHPSNSLLIKNIVELTPKTIKNFLFLWHENYFKHFNKKEIVGVKYEPKNKEKYIFNSWPKDSSIFECSDFKTNKKQKFKYSAQISYDSDYFDSKQNQIFLLNAKIFEDEIKQFAKKLGYKQIDFTAFSIFTLYANNKELVEEKILKENSKKIMHFVADKMKNLNEDDFLYSRYYLLKRDPEEIKNSSHFQNEHLWSDPNNYKNSSMDSNVFLSFTQTGKAFSNKFFVINKNNEIESSHEMTDNYIKQKLNLFEKFAEKGLNRIVVFEQNDKTLEQTYKKQREKYEENVRVLPIKLKDEKGKKFAVDFAKQLLNFSLGKDLNYNKGLIYKEFNFSNVIEDNFLGLYRVSKDSVKPFEDYIFKNFNELMKNFKPKERDLNELKKQYKENYNSFKDEYKTYLKQEKNTIKDLKTYLETGEIEKNSILEKKDLKIKDFIFIFPFSLINKADHSLLTFYRDYNDFYEFFNNSDLFFKKYKKKINEKATPEFIKEFLNNILIPSSNKLKQAFKKAEEKLKALDLIKLSDITDLTKTAYLVEDKNEIERVNNNLKKNIIKGLKIVRV